MLLKSPYPELPPTPEVNIHHFLWDRPDQAAWPNDFTFHIDARTGKKRMYQEFRERARLGAAALGSSVAEGGLGIQGGDMELVGIVSHNSSDYVALVHSLLILTTPFVLIPAYATPFELNHILELTKPTRLFTHANLLPSVLPVAKGAGVSTENVYILGGKAEGRKSFKEMIKDAQSRKTPLASPRPATKDTLAYLTLSSGTSGLPKAVMISHGNIIFSLCQAISVAVLNARISPPRPPNTPEGIPVQLAGLPMHHTYGALMCFYHAFLAPVTIVLLDRWNLDVALQAIPRYKVSSLPLVPSLIHQVVHHPRVKDIDFSSVQSLMTAAAYLPRELNAKFTALMPQVNQNDFGDAYGMSESTATCIFPAISGALGGKLKRVQGSAGVLLPSLQARLVRDDGTDADFNEVGELWIKGKNVALGYWNNENATRETFVDGWLRTGDRFRVNEDGYFFFADRGKDTLKISGQQVSPMEIEGVLLSEPRKLITDVSVAGVSGGRTVDERVPRAWVVLSPAGKKLGAEATVKELKEWHEESLSKYKWLRGGIEVVNEIPKSPTGKVLRRILQEKYEQKAAKNVKGKL